ncbi:hypothetical protein [Vreelandella gomseomensis]|uniref:Uncharacterized protein n=1 Tax=Vreelandella gomseomensis TaxID=370766 RepID=A0ABU1GAY4_9GAMM|nr:hypothetical protein [Halomonas gomseomensis]MDR5874648.1 hypothetical protein [Halomonas gomseomensis]
MNIFEDDEIVATGYDGKEIRVAYKDVKNLQECIGVHTIDKGATSMAGPRKEFIKIETIDGNILEIPRALENDTEILNFLFRGKRS